MRALIQRVSRAQVSVQGGVKSKINHGLLVFLGVTHTDTEEQAKKLADKIVHLRIFSDEEGKMNLSVLDTNGEIMVVSQFTLYGDTKGSRRPSFTEAARPEQAEALYLKFVDYVNDFGVKVKTGEFQAMMEVELVNDGPVTLMIEQSRSAAE